MPVEVMVVWEEVKEAKMEENEDEDEDDDEEELEDGDENGLPLV